MEVGSIAKGGMAAGLRRKLSANGYGALLLALIVLASLPLFWIGFTSLGQAWATPEYSHGPIIPVLSAYLFLSDMRNVPPTSAQVRDRWPGVATIVVALTIAAIGNLVRIPDIVTYAFILWVGGMVILSFGFRRGILFWPGVLHLVFMLPLPNFLYWKLTIALQLMSSEIGVFFLQLVNIPVFLEGNVIDLGIYKLQVAEACSGLRYLFPILSFSYVFSMIYRGPRWHKVVLLLTAAPITILMNSFRIAVIGVLVDQYGIAQADGFLHLFEGWVIFGACVGILFLLAMLMQRMQPVRKPLSDVLEIDFSGLGAQLARVTTVPQSAALKVAATICVLTALIWVGAPKGNEVARVEREPFGFFPLTAGDWTGFTAHLEPQVEAVLAADDYIQASYTASAEAAPVEFFAAFYHRQTDGSGIHSPEVCLPVGGWEMYDIKSVQLTVPTSGWQPFSANRAIVRKGEQQQIVYYWFEQRGRRLTNDFHVKLVAMWDMFRSGRSDGALVRYSTRVLPGETLASADARIRRLMGATLGDLSRFLPE